MDCGIEIIILETAALTATVLSTLSLEKTQAELDWN